MKVLLQAVLADTLEKGRFTGCPCDGLHASSASAKPVRPLLLLSFMNLQTAVAFPALNTYYKRPPH